MDRTHDRSACRGWVAAWVIAVAGAGLALPDSDPPPGIQPAETVLEEASAVAEDEAAWRDPFWPVNYVRPAPSGPAAATSSVPVVAGPVENPAATPVAPPRLSAEERIQRARALLRVGGGVRRGPKCYATINGMLVEAGDTIPVPVDGELVVFVVRSIDLRRIKIEPRRP